MKEILQLGNEIKLNGVEPEIIKIAIELVVDAEITLALTELNEWTEKSNNASIHFD